MEENKAFEKYQELFSEKGAKEKAFDELAKHYFDRNFEEHTTTFDGFFARTVQHEYDHLEGHVFTDHISPIRRQMISNKLKNISNGKVRCSYKTK